VELFYEAMRTSLLSRSLKPRKLSIGQPHEELGFGEFWPVPLGMAEQWLIPAEKHKGEGQCTSVKTYKNRDWVVQ